ncbi:MAG: DUF4339 domain-containing protein [Acidobacteriota bacterium]
MIHLSRPGGQREGPFSIAQINQDLASHKYEAADFWAWYEGLSEWVPLSSVPGVSEIPDPPESSASGFDAEYPEASEVFASSVPTSPAAPIEQTPMAPPPTEMVPLTSGMPFTALEQIFILTTGDGQAASRSPTTISLLQKVIGEDWSTIREVVPRDAIAKCSVLTEMGKGRTPALVWRAMTAFKPLLLQQARDGLHRICIRTFQVETGDTVSVFLFYNKQKMQ